MKNSEILELSNEDLTALIAQESAALTKLKFAHAVSAIENPKRIRFARRNVARLQTELTKRKAAQQATVVEDSAAEAK